MPDVRRAAALDARMHTELAASLEYLKDVCDGVVDVPAAAVDRLISSLRRGRPRPASVFATYYELAFALQNERLSDAQAAWLRLGEAPVAPPGLEICALGDPKLGSDTRLYQDLMSGDPDTDLGFVAPSLEVAADFRARLSSGLARLRDLLPALAGEIESIVRQIIIVGSDPSKEMQVDGGSHYQLWGTLYQWS